MENQINQEDKVMKRFLTVSKVIVLTPIVLAIIVSIWWSISPPYEGESWLGVYLLLLIALSAFLVLLIIGLFLTVFQPKSSIEINKKDKTLKIISLIFFVVFTPYIIYLLSTGDNLYAEILPMQTTEVYINGQRHWSYLDNKSNIEVNINYGDPVRISWKSNANSCYFKSMITFSDTTSAGENIFSLNPLPGNGVINLATNTSNVDRGFNSHLSNDPNEITTGFFIECKNRFLGIPINRRRNLNIAEFNIVRD